MIPSLMGSAQLFQTAEYYLERSLMGLEREDLCRRLGPANSILWHAGHMTIGRCRLLCLLGPGGGQRPVPWVAIFGKGANEPEATALPEVGEVMALWEALRVELPVWLEGLDEGTVAAPAPYDMPCSGQTVLGMINYMAFHEAYHLGQINLARKALGRGHKRRTIDVVLAAASQGEPPP